MAILTAAQVRARLAKTPAAGLLDDYIDDEVAELVDEFREAVETYRGYAHEPTTVTEEIEVPYPTQVLPLRWPLVRSITSLTIDGTVIDPSLYRPLKRSGEVKYSGWFSPEYPSTVVYSHGLDAPGSLVKRCAALYVQLVVENTKNGTDRNIITRALDGASEVYSTPNMALDRPTGWLEVDRLMANLPIYRLPPIA